MTDDELIEAYHEALCSYQVAKMDGVPTLSCNSLQRKRP